MFAFHRSGDGLVPSRPMFMQSLNAVAEELQAVTTAERKCYGGDFIPGPVKY